MSKLLPIVDSCTVTNLNDPVVPQWAAITLPDAWPDQLNFRRPGDLWKLISHIAGRKQQRVTVPDNLPGREQIPKYILQEFHNLPNGNYSKKLTRGYITGFDRVMLGQMRKARSKVASSFKNMSSVLDVGCAGGRMAGVLKQQGVDDVWGLDPSAYLLQHAANDYPDINFVQGVAEETAFPDQRFDGITACFVFHEIPTKYAEASFAEFHRILKPGGIIAICEPSVEQAKESLWAMLRRHGLKGLYFSWMARRVYEPFLDAWHRQDVKATLDQQGFEMLVDDTNMPVRHIVARKRL
jgi:ubiquinone/menaquinone biosynthesis C-methylase UbiE